MWIRIAGFEEIGFAAAVNDAADRLFYYDIADPRTVVAAVAAAVLDIGPVERDRAAAGDKAFIGLPAARAVGAEKLRAVRRKDKPVAAARGDIVFEGDALICAERCAAREGRSAVRDAAVGAVSVGFGGRPGIGAAGGEVDRAAFAVKDIIVQDLADVEEVASGVDFLFSAVCTPDSTVCAAIVPVPPFALNVTVTVFCFHCA